MAKLKRPMDYVIEGLMDGLMEEPIPELVEAVKSAARSTFENPYKQINDAFSDLCDKKGGT